LAEVAATWSGISCTQLCDSVYGEKVDRRGTAIDFGTRGNDYVINQLLNVDIGDDDEEELFNFDDNRERPNEENKTDRKEESNDVAPALFLAYVLLYYAKVINYPISFS
jgi:hypothetical protein